MTQVQFQSQKWKFADILKSINSSKWREGLEKSLQKLFITDTLLPTVHRSKDGFSKKYIFYIWFINYPPSGGRLPGFGLTMTTATVLQTVNNLTYLFSSIKPSNQYRNNMQSANIDCKQISQLIELVQIMKIKFRQFLIIHFFLPTGNREGSPRVYTQHTLLPMCCCLELEEHRLWCSFYLYEYEIFWPLVHSLFSTIQ